MGKKGTVATSVPMTPEQTALVDDYCDRHGYKKSAWMRRLALDAVMADRAVMNGGTQIDPAYFGQNGARA